jgi:hypothetical protein
MAITVFPNETILIEMDGETLVQTDALHRSGKQYVAVDREGRTDFPVVYDNGRVVYDYPEWFSREFKDAVQSLIGKAK